MNKSLTPFLSEIIDYAGLYPPASLPLNEAFNKYIEHSSSKESWMLSKFVVGTNRLDDLIGLINNSDKAPQPFDLTVVAAPSTNAEEFRTVVSKTKEQILSIQEKSNKLIKALSLEIKLPSELTYDEAELLSLIDLTASSMNSASELPEQVFFEIPGFEFLPSHIEPLTRAISTHNEESEKNELANYLYSGFKIRCGGVEAFQFPPISYLTTAIHIATINNTPTKFTAGLHHPIRHFNDSVQTKMHGFLNVFGASILARAGQLSENEIHEMIADETADNFAFTEDAFQWKSHSVEMDQIQKLRTLSVTSFGSCSFDEPVEDLQELNLLT
ncbi:MAG: hypothetical protein JXR20_05890 [Balneola sp.]